MVRVRLPPPPLPDRGSTNVHAYLRSSSISVFWSFCASFGKEVNRFFPILKVSNDERDHIHKGNDFKLLLDTSKMRRRDKRSIPSGKDTRVLLASESL